MSLSEHKKTSPDTVFLIHFNRIIFPSNLDEVISYKVWGRHNLPRNAREGLEIPVSNNNTSEVKKLVGDESEPGISTQGGEIPTENKTNVASPAPTTSSSSQGQSNPSIYGSMSKPPTLFGGSNQGSSNSGKSFFSKLALKVGSSEGAEISTPGSPLEFKWDLIKDTEPVGKKDQCKEALQTILNNQQGLAIISLSSEIPLMKRYLKEMVGLTQEEVDKIYFIPPLDISGVPRNRSDIKEGYKITLDYFKSLGWDGQNGFIAVPFNEDKQQIIDDFNLHSISQPIFDQLKQTSVAQKEQIDKGLESTSIRHTKL